MTREEVFTETLMRLAKKMDYKTALIGRNLYVKFPNTGKRFKIYIESFARVSGYIDGFMCIAINKAEGVIDKCEFRFCDYFDEGACRRFNGYSNCVPEESDFKRIAEAIDEYIAIMR